MRQQFSIPGDKEVRLWNRYVSNTYEPLSKKDASLQDSGLYPGQVKVVAYIQAGKVIVCVRNNGLCG